MLPLSATQSCGSSSASLSALGKKKGRSASLSPFFLAFEELLQTLHYLSFGCFEAPAPEQMFVGFSFALGVTPQNKAQLIYHVRF